MSRRPSAAELAAMSDADFAAFIDGTGIKTVSWPDREHLELHPEPLRPDDEWDDFPRRVGEANAYMLGWRPRREPSDPPRSGMVLVWVGLVLAALVALIIAALIVNAATPRPAVVAIPVDAPVPGVERHGPGVASNGNPPRLTGAPQETAGPNVPSLADGLAAASRRISGTATWYCSVSSACTRGYDPSDMVAAIDSDLGFAKGDRILVSAFGRSVVVTIVDICACAGDRLVDLTRGAFARLANPDLGVIPVTLELAGSVPTAPTTNRAP